MDIPHWDKLDTYGSRAVVCAAFYGTKQCPYKLKVSQIVVLLSLLAVNTHDLVGSKLASLDHLLNKR